MPLGTKKSSYRFAGQDDFLYLQKLKSYTVNTSIIFGERMDNFYEYVIIFTAMKCLWRLSLLRNESIGKKTASVNRRLFAYFLGKVGGKQIFYFIRLVI